MWLIRSVLKYCKVLKFYDQDCLKIFFLLSTLPMMIQISGENIHLPQKVSSFKKLPISNSEMLSRVIFWPKLNKQNITYTKPLRFEA